MKVLITGHLGQLGRALSARAPAGMRIMGADLPDIDVTNPDALRRICAGEPPGLIFNAAAYTAVDRAEQEAETAMRINADGAGCVAEFAAEIDARLIHFSTDFVFGGEKSRPYLPGDHTRPLGVYGASKQAGEQRVIDCHPQQSIVLRTAWLYGHEGANFVLSILRMLGEKEQLGIVADQIGTPTWTCSLADVAWEFAAKTKLKGIYHWTDAGAASWYDFAVAIQEEAIAFGIIDKSIPILPISTEEYPTPAKRPPYSVLDKSDTYRDLQITPVHWRINLRNMLGMMVPR